MRAALLPCALLAALALTPSPARADYIDHVRALDDIGKMKIPRQGSPQILVLPVVIDDQPFEGGADEAAWLDANRAFFQDGLDGDAPLFPAADGAAFAFETYFARQSLGAYRPQAIVAAPVRFATCPPMGPHADCAVPRGGGLIEGDLQGAAGTIRDALAFFDEIMRCAFYGPNEEVRCTEGPAIDPATFDRLGPDGGPDGFIDGVIIVSNAPFPGIALPVKDLSQNAILAATGPLPRFTYGDVTVGAVAVSGREGGDQRGRWVAVHELGHLLGFADLYDESGQTTDLPYSLMGGWFYDEPASLLDPFSRAVIGWARLQQVTGPGTYRLDPAWRTGHALVVGAGAERFLLDLRVRRDDVDADLQVDFGVALFRVRLERWPSAEEGGYLQTLAECVDCAPFGSLLMIEEADGAYDLQFGRPRSDAEDLFQAGDALGPSDDEQPRGLDHPVSSTNLLSGAPTGITITVDDVSADGATITIDAPAVDDGCAALADLCRERPCTIDDGAALCGPPLPMDAPFAPPPPPPGSCQGCGAAALLLAPLARRRSRRR